MFAIAQLKGKFASFHIEQFERSRRMPRGFECLAGKQRPAPKFDFVGSLRSHQERSAASLGAAPKDGGVLRWDDTYRQADRHSNEISHRYTQCGRCTAEDRDAGIGGPFFNLNKHAFAHAGFLRQLIERQAALPPERFEVLRHRGADAFNISDRLSRYIDFLFHGRYIDQIGQWELEAVLNFPVVDKEIAGIAPDFRAISILVDANGTKKGRIDPNILLSACDYVASGGPEWGDAHLANWGDVYSRFGAKPNRTPCSALALKKRVEKDGRIPSINPVVDLYNAVSLRFAIPVGGENFDAYVGRPRLAVAEGTEPFDTVMNSEPIIESPSKGEVIWRDDVGATCRRWNWRQGTRTRLETVGGRMWFILESLSAMPQEALEEAANMLMSGLRELSPGCEIYKQNIMVG